MPLEQYAGKEELLLITLDIGTTMSAATVTHLQPRQVPIIETVSKWPEAPYSSEIPTTILYNNQGKAEAFGAECDTEEMRLIASSRNYHEAKWFKLHVHPESMAPPAYSESEKPSVFEKPPLPAGVTIKQCYSDFIGYLYENTKLWFAEHFGDGEVIWKRLIGSCQFVLAHPNGWTVTEQTFLREAMCAAALDAGNKLSADRISFVSEGEASFHFGMEHGSAMFARSLSPGMNIAVVDAGGSTVDISVYTVNQISPKITLKEARSTACTQDGGIFVVRAGSETIRRKLQGSRFDTPDFIEDFTTLFESKVMPKFSSVDKSYIMKFGHPRDTDDSVGISRGHLSLSGSEVELSFLRNVNNIVKSVNEQILTHPVQFIILVGGFGESPYVARILTETFQTPKCKIVSVNQPSKKAVAVGTALHYIQHSITARATRFEYGISVVCCFTQYGHLAGSRETYLRQDGSKKIRGGWSAIVGKNTVHEAGAWVKSSFNIQKGVRDSLLHKTKIYSYDGDSRSLDIWMTDESGNLNPGFRRCCNVEADLSSMTVPSNLHQNQDTGESYWELNFMIGIMFGETSMKAKIFWNVNGITKESDAAILSNQI